MNKLSTFLAWFFAKKKPLMTQTQTHYPQDRRAGGGSIPVQSVWLVIASYRKWRRPEFSCFVRNCRTVENQNKPPFFDWPLRQFILASPQGPPSNPILVHSSWNSKVCRSPHNSNLIYYQEMLSPEEESKPTRPTRPLPTGPASRVQQAASAFASGTPPVAISTPQTTSRSSTYD